MSRLTIDTGTEGNPATGDSLRGAFTKVNTNFQELYAELGGDSLDTLIFTNNTISSGITNGTLVLEGNGTGAVDIEGIQVNDNQIITTTSNANLLLDGNGTGTVVINGLSFPIADGTAGQVLKTDGAGNLSFTAVDPGAITFVGDDSTGTAVNIGETIKIAGAQNITTAVSGDTLTITGSKNIQVNEISSGDSTAVQVNDGLNVSGSIAASSIVVDNLLTGIKTSTIVSGVLTLDFTFGTHIVNHNANITSISFTNASAVKSSQVTVILTQDATGGRTITGSYATAGGLGLDISTTANAVNIVTFFTRDNSTFFGFSNGKSFS